MKWSEVSHGTVKMKHYSTSNTIAVFVDDDEIVIDTHDLENLIDCINKIKQIESE